MVAGISSINPHISRMDPEYLRILAELRKLGISPSGDKEIDKAKLQQAKSELITKIKKKEHEDERASKGVQIITSADEVQDNKRAEMEEQRLGAMTVAELNRLYFGI